MAEYYPLLARAVAGMRNAPAAERLAIYDRARQALLGQLRSMRPPVPEASIDRESTALDEAIARLETEFGAPVEARSTPAPEAASAAPSPATPPPQPVPSATVAAMEPWDEPAVPGSGVATPPEPRVPTPPPPIFATPPRPARPAADSISRIVAERGPPAPIIRALRAEDEVSTGDSEARGGSASGAMPAAPRLQMPSFDDALTAAGGETEEEAAFADDAALTSREEPLRPQAPRPTTRERFNPRALILTTVGLLVVAGIGYAAWRLRDRPEQLARAREAMLTAQQAEQQSAAKISSRADSGAAAPPPAIAPVPVPASGSSPEAKAPAQPASIATPTAAQPATAAVQAPATAPAAPDAQTSLAAATPAVGAPAGSSSTAIPVAQRAAFLVDAPDEAQKVKTYVGTVVWTTENAAPGTDQPLARTVHAEVEIPEAALKMSLIFQKNFETQFPASHTLELHFTLLPGNTFGPIKQINVPQMRKDDSPTGDPLIGLPVTITDNYFLVGLSRGDATARNLDLIKTRNWFDVPMLLTSGKVAKITFEKGATGQQAIDDVLQNWQQ